MTLKKTVRSNGKNLEIEKAGEWVTLASFTDNIIQVEKLPDGSVVVTTDITKNSTDRNIFVVDEHRGVRWQIMEAQRLEERPNPYSGFEFKRGKLIAYSVQGAEYYVDLQTGNIKYKDFNRF